MSDGKQALITGGCPSPKLNLQHMWSRNGMIMTGPDRLDYSLVSSNRFIGNFTP